MQPSLIDGSVEFGGGNSGLPVSAGARSSIGWDKSIPLPVWPAAAGTAANKAAPAISLVAVCAYRIGRS
jgi:hypothetical protein